MPTVDAETASLLTPEELAAINAEDTPEELAAQAAAAAAADDDDSDGGDDDQLQDHAPEPAPELDQPADKVAPSTDADDLPPAEVAEALPSAKDDAALRYEAQLPSDYDEQIKALRARDAELRKKYKDGDIDIDARDAELSALAEQREALLVARAKSEISHEMNQQAAQQQWQRAINVFMADAAKGEGAINYRTDEAKAADLDEFVKNLAKRPENSDKPMEWFLHEAHKRVQALHGVSGQPAAPASTTAPVDPKKLISDAAKLRKPSAGAIPKTLAQVPGGDGPGDVTSEFADVLALEGQAFEDALARMTPAQRERFVAES